MNRIYRLGGSDQSTAVISALLRKSGVETRRALRRNAAFFRRVDLFRERLLSVSEARRLADAVRVPEESAFQCLCSEDPRSRIIAAYHFGDYVLGLNRLLCLENRKRSLHVLGLEKLSVEAETNLRHAFGQQHVGRLRQLEVRNTSTTDISALLRRGPANLITFADLPPQFGQTVSVKFLHRSAWFTKGAVLLALCNRVPILPVLCVSEFNETRVLLGNQIEPGLRKNESLAQRVESLSQKLVSLLEHHVSRSPEQWRYLSLLDTYFPSGRNSRDILAKET